VRDEGRTFRSIGNHGNLRESASRHGESNDLSTRSTVLISGKLGLEWNSKIESVLLECTQTHGGAGSRGLRLAKRRAAVAVMRAEFLLTRAGLFSMGFPETRRQSLDLTRTN
jgi:hypothetical protein